MSSFRRGRRRNFSTSSERRPTDWASAQFNTTLTGATDVDTVDLLESYKEDGGWSQGCTVIRTHLKIQVLSDVVAGEHWAFGLMKGQNVDLGLNVAGAPDPVGDPYGDWLLWGYFNADTNGRYFPAASNTMVYDLKSMR